LLFSSGTGQEKKRVASDGESAPGREGAPAIQQRHRRGKGGGGRCALPYARKREEKRILLLIDQISDRANQKGEERKREGDPSRRRLAGGRKRYQSGNGLRGTIVVGEERGRGRIPLLCEKLIPKRDTSTEGQEGRGGIVLLLLRESYGWEEEGSWWGAILRYTTRHGKEEKEMQSHSFKLGEKKGKMSNFRSFADILNPQKRENRFSSSSLQERGETANIQTRKKVRDHHR